MNIHYIYWQQKQIQLSNDNQPMRMQISRKHASVFSRVDFGITLGSSQSNGCFRISRCSGIIITNMQSHSYTLEQPLYVC